MNCEAVQGEINKADVKRMDQAKCDALWLVKRIVWDLSDGSHITGGNVTSETYEAACEILERAGL